MVAAHLSRLTATCLLILTPSSWASFAAQTLQPVEPAWRVDGQISSGKDISGIACVPPTSGPRRCLLAVDEGFSAVFVSLDGRTIKQDDTIRLAPEVNKQEIDAEGAAYDEQTRAFYVIGSHGRPRHKCKRANPSSYNLARLPVNPATGRPDFDYASGVNNPDWVAPQITLSRHIGPAMHRSAELSPNVEKCLPSKTGNFPNEHGANIEGIALVGKTLYVGFRGPVAGDTAYLLAFDRDGLFQPQPLAAVTIPVKLGSWMGVRDLAAVKEGLLILSGPEDDVPGSAAIHRFDPQTRAVTLLGNLPAIAPKAKPEALLVLDQADDSYRVLILSDGVNNGAPTEFVVPKGG
jgi:hypothetical protein